MSTGYDPQVDVSQVEQARRQINRLAEEIAQLSETELSPPEYYGEFLQRILGALAAPAGAIWIRTPQGNLQLQYQINMRQVGLDRNDKSRKMHDELLRQALMKGQPGLIPPQSSMGPVDGEAVPAGNPTDHVILLAPIIHDKQVQGLVEIWQESHRGPDAQRGFLQFVVRMAGLAAGYTRNHQLRQMVGQQQVWVQLEAFSRQIHNSLNPTEVAYLIVNEGRRLLEADRVSVAQRIGRKAVVRAISGADVVEKRSNLVQLMRALFEKVIEWGEKLVYTGTKDDTLPPNVLHALDAYLAESNSKVLVVLPLKDDRENAGKRKARSAIMMESFETTAAPEQAVAKLDVLARHATSALYNAAEYQRIPMRFFWLPLAKVQEGLGGKAKAIGILATIAATALILAMIFVPYPLKMDAKGNLLPKDRVWVYAPVEGHIREINSGLRSGSRVHSKQELIRMHDHGLAEKINALDLEIHKANATIIGARPQTAGGDNSEWTFKVEEARIMKAAKMRERDELMARTNSDPQKPGYFRIKAPLTGVVLNADFRENLTNRHVKPNEPLIRIGKADIKNPDLNEWEIELHIPQKHIGQVLDAFQRLPEGSELDVDLLLISAPTQVFRGKLRRDKIASEAKVDRNDNQEPEPLVVAWVRISGDDIPAESRLPANLLLTGTEVHARVRCGNRAMGYSLFYGVWEFIYEKVVFFF